MAKIARPKKKGWHVISIAYSWDIISDLKQWAKLELGGKDVRWFVDGKKSIITIALKDELDATYCKLMWG